MLPHRYPFLLVDRILELDHEHALTLKNVTCNEPFFMGHFPGRPVMPGVLIIEAMAQSAGLLALTISGGTQTGLLMLTGVDGLRLRRPVVPGDQLQIEVRPLRYRRPLWRMRAQARVDGELVAEGEISAVEAKEQRP